MKRRSLVEGDLHWYKRAIIYQAHVRAFRDSNGDGVGDFRGLTEKLDYIADLGADVLWILPFYPSPLRDGGYDISDYTAINPAYGTLEDFERFVEEAHLRNIRVMTELVLNHTSDQHPWFQRARRAEPGSRWRDFYVWTDDPSKYSGTRIIFKDFETSNWSWDPVAKQYYWHRFYNHQPDLNWDNPEVEQEMLKLLDFWLDTGVDGLRLDAIPYLYEREGTTCENLPETHDALKRVRAYMDEKYPGRALLAEANQWPEDAVAYFGEGDECHMAFHFPIMPRLYMSMETEDRFPLIDIIRQTPEIPDSCQWITFLRNHDELTLEMVSDEERDYMYKAYASDPRARINLGIRRRLAPLLGNDIRKVKLLNGLLFSFNGTPVVYYGDEIGMGDNIYLGDRDGVRTPMQWSADRNAGFSDANPQQLYLPVNIDPEYRYEAVNVEAQQRNTSSLYWWMKRLISLRKRYDCLATGDIEFLLPDNGKVLAFLRRTPEQQILVVANLSRSVQYAELNLEDFEGRVPLEVFGRTRFPRVGRLPYLLTLGPYDFYWFDLSRPSAPVHYDDVSEVPIIDCPSGWPEMLKDPDKRRIEKALPELLGRRRWFGGKSRSVDEVEIVEQIPFEMGTENRPLQVVMTFLDVHYENHGRERFALPLAFSDGELARRLVEEHSWAALLRLRRPDGSEALLLEGVDLAEFRQALLRAVDGSHGPLRGTRTEAAPEAWPEGDADMLRAEQSNTSLVFGDEVVLKLFRKLESGTNPDVEIGRFLTSKDFEHTPRVLGSVEWTGLGGETTVAIAQSFVPNQGDAWGVTLGEIGLAAERLLNNPSEVPDAVLDAPIMRLVRMAEHPGRDYLSSYVPMVELLGQRTAELHFALASEHDDPTFAPETFTAHYQRGLYQSMRSLASRTFENARRAKVRLPEELGETLDEVLKCESEVFSTFDRTLKGEPLSGARLRCHGDYHLGQVLFTGRDWNIIDFEGEPARSLSERRIKRSPLRDVAGMLRSFEYAFHAGLEDQQARGNVERDTELFGALERGLRLWLQAAQASFLGAYLSHAEGAHFLPDRLGIPRLLEAYLMEKAVYELNYELNHRPKMVSIPARGILSLAAQGTKTS
ncbi:MAG: maltose alpha-D-glucosyltransferase [Myxococcota bacterium]